MLATILTSLGEIMLIAALGPPSPGGGVNNPPPDRVPAFKLTIPKFVNQRNDIVLWILEPQSNAVYELQFATNLNSPITWTPLARGLAGQVAETSVLSPIQISPL